jgi:hypothetical protein
MKIIGLIENKPLGLEGNDETVFKFKVDKNEEQLEEIFEEKDNRFLQLQEVIDTKRKILLKNQIKLKNLSKDNEFLENIKSDYVRYNNYILQQKKDQMSALKLLNEYISDLNSTGELSEQNIKDSKYEQKKILKELTYIQNSLNSLIEKDSDFY